MTTLGAEITAATNSAIAAAESRLNGGVDERVAGAIAAERAVTAELVQRRVTEGLAGLDGRIDERLGARLGTLRGELEGALMGRIDERMAATGARLDGQVNDLAQRIGRIEQDLPERIAEDVTARIGDLRAALQEETRAEIARASEAAAAGLTARLDEAVRAAQAALREQTSRLIDERLADLDARIATVSRATADLEAEIGAEVTRQLTAADITGQVAAATAESQRGLLTRLERGLADQQARTSAAITAASDGLRADLTREIDSRLANERLRTTEMLRATETRLTTEISRFTPTRPGPVIRRPTGGNPG
jgi:SpoVK/Ycf46/Vps4 family AAA+-type ATPase